MRKIIYTALLFMVLLLVLPLCAVKRNSKPNLVQTNAYTDGVYVKAEKSESFRVLISDSKKIEVMSAEDYIFGVVAAEMPALYESEALKAQAVAAYSFACIRRAQNKNLEYDITTDPALDQSYLNLDAAKLKWGENYNEYREKILNAVKAVSGKTVKYKGEIALTLYHAISSGKTENSLDVWGGEYEYLTSVDSVWDKLSPNYLSSQTFSFDELKVKLSDYNFASNNIKADRTNVGTVKSLKVDGKEISGEKLRESLNLRSANFSVKVDSAGVTFETVGYGHGVGMSQYGADYMAKQGADYKEILKHYYKNATVE